VVQDASRYFYAREED